MDSINKSNNNIVIVGSCMMDFVSYAPRLPKRGETIHGSKFVTSCGGKGANQCVAAAKLGGKTTLIARVGNDIWGEQYIDNLKNYKISTDYIQLTPNTTTGIAQITVATESGENQIVIVAGANNILSPTDIDLAKDVIDSASVVVVQLETSLDVALATLNYCKNAKISILNGAPAIADYPPELLTLPTIFCVNETEAAVFSKERITNIKTAKMAAWKLIKEYACQNVIITLGDKGTIYFGTEWEEPTLIPTPTVECVDTTGAGDAFIGALAYILANIEGATIIKAIQCANIYATDSVKAAGTQNSFGGIEVIKDILKSIT